MSNVHRDIFASIYGGEYEAEQEAQIQSENDFVDGVCDNCNHETEINQGYEYGCDICGVGTIKDIVTIMLIGE